MNIKLPKARLPRFAVILCLVVFAMVTIFVFSVRFGVWGKVPEKKELSNFQYQRASEVYTSDSILIGKYYLFDRQPITYEEFPKHLLNALVAIEDQRYYKHSGIDYPSLFRVALKTILMQDQSSGGGSTLTQQLAKNLYPRKNRKKANMAVNKVKEMIIAKRLEDIYTKEEILAHYLNTVSFGGNTFGIESASLKFFNKKAKLLSIEEAAVLVGMLKATYGYNPKVFPKKGLNRRNLVLESMYKNEFLSAEEKDSLMAIPLRLNYKEFDHTAGIAPYFREEVRKNLVKWSRSQKEAGNVYNIYTSGLKIYTTLSHRMQVMAEDAMKIHLKSLQKSFEKSYGTGAPWKVNKKIIEKAVRSAPHYKKMINNGLNHKEAWDSLNIKRKMELSDWNGNKKTEASPIDSVKHYLKFLNTGSLSIDPKTGAVLTWIGGIDYKIFKYDHVSQSKRQVGSTFKPIVYTAALEAGISPCSYFSAQEVEYENLKGWSPGNSSNKDEKFLNYSMEMALSNSVNTVAVKVLEKTGIDKVLIQAKNMGIFSELPKQPSLALGTGAIYVNELAGAYAGYVNGGKAVIPYLIKTITDQKDSVLATFKPKRAKIRAFSKETGEIMLEMMKSTINQGTASRIRSTYNLKNDIAGKTGTTQNNKDAWFVALTPKLVHVTWVGLDHHEIGFRSTSLGQGANAALPLFALFMQKMNRDASLNHITKAHFPKPETSVLRQLDCEPIKRDGFFKRLFKNPNKKRTKRFRTRK